MLFINNQGTVRQYQPSTSVFQILCLRPTLKCIKTLSVDIQCKKSVILHLCAFLIYKTNLHYRLMITSQIEIRKSHPISESYSVFLVEDKNRIIFLTQAGGSFVLLASSLTNSKWPVDLVNKSAKTKVQIPICRQMGLNSGHLKVGVKSVDLYNLGKGFLASRAFQKCDEAQHFS